SFTAFAKHNGNQHSRSGSGKASAGEGREHAQHLRVAQLDCIAPGLWRLRRGTHEESHHDTGHYRRERPGKNGSPIHFAYAS
ncbi:MAG: hypothetical protein ACI91B_002974, partial [Planctomycetota bacterium]